MKTLAAATVLLAAATAAPLASRQSSKEFDVQGLTFGCVPHSSHCYFDLNVTVSASKPKVVCNIDALSYQSVPDLPLTGCEDNSVSISYTHVDGGANLVVNWGYDVGRNLTGTHFVRADEVVYTNTEFPTGRVQVYNGTKDFAITDLKATAVL